MAMTALEALLNDPPDPPKPPRPPAPKPASTAFQRTLAEQRAAARNAPEPTPARPTTGARTTRQTASATASRAAAERDSRGATTMERPSPDTPFAAGGYGGAWGGGVNTGTGTGSGGGQGNLAGASADLPIMGDDADLDCEMLCELLPGEGDSGIFELLLPGGDRLAVVADIGQRQASFLLTPSSDRLRQQINKRKMELEKGLAQRMDRHVRLTVL